MTVRRDRRSRIGFNRSRLIPCIAALAVLIAPSAAQGPPPATVRLDAARMESLMVPRSVTGEIVSLRRSLLASQVEGFVVELPVNEGDAVKQGEVIAHLDDEMAALDVRKAEADVLAAKGEVAQREAELARFSRDLERLQLLEGRGGTTASEIDAADANVRTTEALLVQAQAMVAAREAERSLAERRLRDMTIRAPFDGRIVRKSTETGEWVTPGDTIVEIVSMTELEVRIDVPEHLVGYLNEDLGSIPLLVPGLGERANTVARVISVIPLGDSLSRMFPVRLSVDGETAGLKPGMSVTAQVPTGSVEPVLTIHKDAVLRDDAGLYVYMAVPNRDSSNPAVTGKAIAARISRQFASGDRVAIRSGQIQAGSFLLVEGNERVFPTQPLIVQDPPPNSPFAGGGGGGSGSERRGGGQPGQAGREGSDG